MVDAAMTALSPAAGTEATDDSESDVDLLRRHRRPPGYIRELSARVDSMHRDVESLREACGVLWDLVQSKAGSEDLQKCQDAVAGLIRQQEKFQEGKTTSKSSSGGAQGKCSGRADQVAFEQVDMLRGQCDVLFGMLQSKANCEDLQSLHEMLMGKVSHQQLHESLVDKVSSSEIEDVLSGKLDNEAFEQLEIDNRIAQANLRAMLEERAHRGELEGLQAQIDAKANREIVQGIQDMVTRFTEARPTGAQVASRASGAFQVDVSRRVDSVDMQETLNAMADARQAALHGVFHKTNDAGDLNIHRAQADDAVGRVDLSKEVFLDDSRLDFRKELFDKGVFLDDSRLDFRKELFDKAASADGMDNL